MTSSCCNTCTMCMMPRCPYPAKLNSTGRPTPTAPGDGFVGASIDSCETARISMDANKHFHSSACRCGRCVVCASWDNLPQHIACCMHSSFVSATRPAVAPSAIALKISLPRLTPEALRTSESRRDDEAVVMMRQS